MLVAAFGFWAWQRGISGVGANRALAYQYLINLDGVASGVLLLGEDLTAIKILGGAVQESGSSPLVGSPQLA